MSRRATTSERRSRFRRSSSPGRRRTDREAERQRFLVEATAVLDTSLDPRETMQNIATRAVPELGELSIIDMLEEDGTISKIAVAAGEPEARRDLEVMRRRFPVNPDGTHPVARVIRSGTPELLPELTEETLHDIAECPEHLELMQRLRYRAALVVPLRARGRTLGAMSVLHTGDTGETYLPEDLAVLEELGRRAAMALDNARLHAEAREAEQRQRFLAESTDILSASLDHHETLRRISRLVVPRLADWCVVDMLDDAGGLERVAVAHVDLQKERLGWELSERYEPKPEDSEGVMKAIRSGEPAIYEEISEETLRAFAEDERHVEILQDIGVKSSMIVPLTIRGRTLGALTFVRAKSGQTYRQRDLELATELARRAAGAVDNARLYTERSHVARTLQNSLLPPQLPEVPGVELASRYRAATGNEVGGDFYDVFKTGESSWAVVVGDVCGKGPEAAAVTALARYSLRAFAVQPNSDEAWTVADDGDPARRLTQLNEAMLRQRTDGRFCTVTYARVDLGDERPRITVASAGHPPPLLMRAGEAVEPFESAGPALGLFRDLELASHARALAAGDAIVFYTDGVTDAGAPERVLAEEDLAALISGWSGRHAEEIAQHVEDETVAVHGEGLRDDAAILVVKLTADVSSLSSWGGGAAVASGGSPEGRLRDPAIRLRIPPEPDSVSRARGALAALEPDLDGDTLGDLSLMVSELVTNSIRHSGSPDGSPMWLQIATHPERIRVEMTDGGSGFEVGEPKPDPDGTGGWGLYLVDRLADRWGVIRAARSTSVWLELDC
jgi:serine phosphatase RsbU (regulator of sigma subunit)/anti-sigma regulatory factor (Ser/Thr protein kinase)